MSRKKVSTTIYITPEQADRLKLLHERTKVPIAVYIREGIDMMLKHYEHMLPGQMSLEAASVSPAPPPVAAPSRRAVPDLQVTSTDAGRSHASHTPPVTLRAGTADRHSSTGAADRLGSASAGAGEPPPAAATAKPSRPGDGGG
jgi:predicted DNA-binding protein